MGKSFALGSRGRYLIDRVLLICLILIASGTQGFAHESSMSGLIEVESDFVKAPWINHALRLNSEISWFFLRLSFPLSYLFNFNVSEMPTIRLAKSTLTLKPTLELDIMDALSVFGLPEFFNLDSSVKGGITLKASPKLDDLSYKPFLFWRSTAKVVLNRTFFTGSLGIRTKVSASFESDDYIPSFNAKAYGTLFLTTSSKFNLWNDTP